uniref:Uncharacterized protein n=1 Tax=Arundo donax TaxID=35708 RepID=A0A0A8YV84_ARUDO
MGAALSNNLKDCAQTHLGIQSTAPCHRKFAGRLILNFLSLLETVQL